MSDIQGLSRESMQKLSDAFLDVEESLENGCSRQLIANALVSLEAIDDERARRFIDQSPYQTERKSMLSSCTLREFLELTSEIVKEYESEEEFVDLFVEALIEEKEGFTERLEHYLTIKANVEDGSSEIPQDQMPKKIPAAKKGNK